MKFIDVFGKAKYVSATNNYQFPYIRKSFHLDKPVKRAELFVSVLGFSELYINGKKLTEDLYLFEGEKIQGDKLVAFYKEIVSEYPIISIEDPFEENDLESLAVLTKLIGDKVMLVGDDYFCTNSNIYYFLLFDSKLLFLNKKSY